MSSPNIQAGDLNKRLRLQDEIETSDMLGGFTTQWVDVRSVWAKLVPIGQSNIESESNSQSRNRFLITLRFLDDLKPNMRFVYGERIFLVTNVSDPDETGRFASCTAYEQPG